jgi:hypothetical protein
LPSLQIPISLAPSIFVNDIGERDTTDWPEPAHRVADRQDGIRVDPNVGITYCALGTCQLLLDRVDQASDLLQTARAANARMWVPYFYLAGAYGLRVAEGDGLPADAAKRGDLDKARSALAESMRLKPAIKSLARMPVENPWLSNPQYWALQEKTLNLGLRRAGLPDQ